MRPHAWPKTFHLRIYLCCAAVTREKVRRESHIALLGQPARDVANVVIQTLVRVYQNQSGKFARRRGPGEITKNRSRFSGEFDFMPKNRRIAGGDLGGGGGAKEVREQRIGRGQAAGKHYRPAHKFAPREFSSLIITDQFVDLFSHRSRLLNAI